MSAVSSDVFNNKDCTLTLQELEILVSRVCQI